MDLMGQNTDDNYSASISIAGSKTLWNENQKPVDLKPDNIPSLIPLPPVNPDGTVIIPSREEVKTDWEEVKEYAKQSLDEYIKAAKQMHIPVPNVSMPEIKLPQITIAPPEKSHPTESVPTRPKYEIKAGPGMPTINEAAAEFIRKNASADQLTAFSVAESKKRQSQKYFDQSGGYLYSDPQTVNNIFDELGKVVSIHVEETKSFFVKAISSLFFLTTLGYATLTVLLFGTIIALAITLTNAGLTGFAFLRYYPNIGLLPLATALATLALLYVSYKVADGSRFGWFVGLGALTIFPAATYASIPILARPLVRLVTVYAGVSDKPMLFPSITITAITQYISGFLWAELIAVLLIIFIKHFKYANNSLTESAKTALAAAFTFLIIPVTLVLGYGYVTSFDNTSGITQAQALVSYKVYLPEFIPGGRIQTAKFKANNELIGKYDAIKATFDLPLTVMVETGKTSPVSFVQVGVDNDFSLDSFIKNEEKIQGLTAQQVAIGPGNGFVFQREKSQTVWALMPENVLVTVFSPNANIDEMVTLIESLR